jgi:hypothetical protein
MDKEIVVPYSNNNYVMMFSIADCNKQISIKVIDKTPLWFEDDKIRLHMFDKTVEASVNWIIAMTICPVFNPHTFIDQISPTIDVEKIYDVKPTDVSWEFINGKIEAPEVKKSYIIPNYSRYCISEDGICTNRETGKILDKITNTASKECYIVISDSKERAMLTIKSLLVKAFYTHNKIVNLHG